ncbi:hypothetical protein BDZ91DRAFT_762487 [Kalaharituber pfeilii]|nr:hypothetical protein BDZ91DRAFT_762487 [Kalaharituber pfeilii]
MKLCNPTITTTTTTLLLLSITARASLLDSLKSKVASLSFPSFLRKIASPLDNSALLLLHKNLIEIPSITGDEKAVAEWLATYLVSRNFTVETQAVGENRENVFAYIGSKRETNTLITSHIDVVPPFIPYRETPTAVYGRGSSDAKGSVAAQIMAVEELWNEGAIGEGDIAMLYVVGEEITGDGMKTANALNPGWKTVIFGEPTELKLAVGHKGIAEFEVISEGRAAHSGYPHLGINANSNLIKVLYGLDNLQLPVSSLLGNSTINIGQIEGGVAANVVPDKAKAIGSVRIAGDLKETVRLINEAVGSVEGVRIVWEERPHYGPVELDYDVEGFETTVCSYGTDVPNLYGDHKKYLYGPGSILVAHGDNEHILKSDLYKAVIGYKKLIHESLHPTRRPPAIIEEQPKPVKVEASEEVVSSAATIVSEKEAETETPVAEAVDEEL